MAGRDELGYAIDEAARHILGIRDFTCLDKSSRENKIKEVYQTHKDDSRCWEYVTLYEGIHEGLLALSSNNWVGVDRAIAKIHKVTNIWQGRIARLRG